LIGAFDHIIPAKVDQAWQQGQNGISMLLGQGVKVGILDSGVDQTNPALQGRITSYANYVNGANTAVGDVAGHGTVIAEILGGKPNVVAPYNTLFPGGVAPLTDLYVARVVPDTGTFNLIGQIPTIASALANLTGQGVRIFNMSYDTNNSIQSYAGSQTDPNSAASLTHNLYQTLVAHNALGVFSAGNKGNGDPGLEGGLPYLFPDMKNNLITVVNVQVDANYNVVGLDKSTDVPSNACGVAAAWCLAAPGSVIFSPVTGTKFSAGGADGTSSSAPQVAGTAALVLQNFPWMSASNLQQTILGTATPLGNTSLYGNGLLNAKAAVNGPGRLDWGMFTANVPGGFTSTFSNVLSGAGGIDMEGAGTLVLTGYNSYTGGTTVGGGVLANRGTLVSDVTVNAGGTLTGRGGQIDANLYNRGTVSTADGSLFVFGNYTADANSKTVVAFNLPLNINGHGQYQRHAADGPVEHRLYRPIERTCNVGERSCERYVLVPGPGQQRVRQRHAGL
jgi:autotransporter-associated beta strand protein